MPWASSQARTALRLGVAHALHGGEQGGLGQALLEDAHGVEQRVVDDGVVHAHAALVEDAEDGLVAREVAGERSPRVRALSAEVRGVEVADVAEVVLDVPGLGSTARSLARKKASVKSSLQRVL